MHGDRYDPFKHVQMRKENKKALSPNREGKIPLLEVDRMVKGPKLKDLYGARTKNFVFKNKIKWANMQDKINASKKTSIPHIHNEPTW